MALTCDNCGEIIGEDEYISIPWDHTQDKLGGCAADDWFYYCEGECAKAVRGMLENLRRSGHEGDTAGLRWELVEAGPTPKTAGEPPEERTTDSPPEKRRNLANPGAVKFGEALIHPRPASVLMKLGIHSIEDVAQKREIELLAAEGLGPATVRQLADELRRRDKKFKPGASMTELAAHLRALRVAAELTHWELVEAIDPRPEGGTSRDSKYELREKIVGSWEQGHVPPPTEVCEALADYFDITLDALWSPWQVGGAVQGEGEDTASGPELDGKRLRALRTQRRLSQREVGEGIELNRSCQPTVSCWETGKQQPSWKELERLAAFFEVPSELLTREEVPA